MKLTGQGGYLSMGGRHVAELLGWRLDGDPGGWEVEGSVTNVDSFWIEHGGVIRLCLNVGNKEWRWTGVAMVLEGEQVIISGAGAPETR